MDTKKLITIVVWATLAVIVYEVYQKIYVTPTAAPASNGTGALQGASAGGTLGTALGDLLGGGTSTPTAAGSVGGYLSQLVSLEGGDADFYNSTSDAIEAFGL
jgi:uncharacterized protein YcfJ